jgi:glyoxylase-like metal-dependent hydrolase (beta-lactamase superfamily II)
MAFLKIGDGVLRRPVKAVAALLQSTRVRREGPAGGATATRAQLVTLSREHLSQRRDHAPLGSARKLAMQGPVEIAPGVFGLGSRFVNWYLIEDGGRLTAIDAGLPGFAGGLDNDLASIGHGIGDIDAVLLTHSDSDHTGLAPRLHEAGARVLIHADDQATLRKPSPKGGDGGPMRLLPELRRPRLLRFVAYMVRNGATRPARIADAETFADGDVLDVPGQPTVVHTPGHTPGHCALLFAGHRALFTGDELCTWNPLTGRTGPQVLPSVFNLSTERCFASLAALEELDCETMLTGHGEAWREGAKAAVARARAAGRS